MQALLLSTDMFYSLLPLLAITFALAISIIAFAIRNAVFGKLQFERVATYETFFLSEFFLNWWLWLFAPLGRLFIRLRISPNVITWMQLPVALVASLLFAMGSFGAAGWVVCFGAMLDFLDGMVAKNTGRVTRAGGFLDSTLDRYVDFFILLGYVAYYRTTDYWLIPMLAILGSLAVPYIRAKAESMGITRFSGGMQRGERIFFLGFFAAIAPIFAAFVERRADHPLYHLALVGCGLVAVFANVTGTLRGLSAMRGLDEKELAEKQTALATNIGSR